MVQNIINSDKKSRLFRQRVYSDFKHKDMLNILFIIFITFARLQPNFYMTVDNFDTDECLQISVVYIVRSL